MVKKLPWLLKSSRERREKRMTAKKFNKKEFIREVKANVKALYRKNLEEATQQQIFQAVSYAVKDEIIENWLATQEQYEKDDPKYVYYMSMEFLMGRALGNNLINLTAYEEVKEALEEIGPGFQCDRRSGAGCSSWKRRTWTSGSLLPGFSGNSGLSGIRMRYPLPLRYVQAED